jgi:hypothetical protein
MDAFTFGIVGAATAAFVILGWQRVIRTYRRYRGAMVIRCPETGSPVRVEVDAGHAAKTAAGGEPDLRLCECSRWPERADCDQACLSEIHDGPERCLVRNLLANWYRGKFCVLCAKEFIDIDSYDHQAILGYDKKPGLVSPEGSFVYWPDIAAESFLEVLATHHPVCWGCMVKEEFERTYPDMVTRRKV